jgi:hypothetical protein
MAAAPTEAHRLSRAWPALDDRVMTMKAHRALWIVQLVTAVALAALVYLSVKGWLTPRQFGIGGLIVLVATCVALTTAFVRRRTTSPRNWPKPHGSRRAKYLKIAAILLYWIAALWLAREGPVSAKLVGSFMLMLFLIATIVRPTRDDHR